MLASFSISDLLQFFFALNSLDSNVGVSLSPGALFLKAGTFRFHKSFSAIFVCFFCQVGGHVTAFFPLNKVSYKSCLLFFLAFFLKLSKFQVRSHWPRGNAAVCAS